MMALIRSQFPGIDPEELDTEAFAIRWREAEYLFRIRSTENLNHLLSALMGTPK